RDHDVGPLVSLGGQDVTGQVVLGNALLDHDVDRLVLVVETGRHGTMPTRLNDPDKAVYIVVQQRIAENELTGDILSTHADAEAHVMIPMRYDWERHSVTSIGWNDPRGLDEKGEPLVLVDEDGLRYPRDRKAIPLLKQANGTLMWPERFSDE